MALTVVHGCTKTYLPGSHPNRCDAPDIDLNLGEDTRPCTYYVAPDGSEENDGLSPASPLTLKEASKRTLPGDVVCLQGGEYVLTRSFYPETSGAPGNYITYRGENHEAVLRWEGGASGDHTMMIYAHWKRNYLEFRGLTLDANNASPSPIFCHYSHHIRVIDNVVKNAGVVGVGTKFCDYVAVVNNRIYHTGYRQGWGSGVSLNSQQWYDNCPGFHSYVLGNIISGSVDESDHHSDGNGIIMDLSDNSYDYDTADTPPVLVANNLVYQNGGRCIHSFVVENIWVVNNTCYKNGLDGRLPAPSEFNVNNANNIYFINNVVQAWGDVAPFQIQGQAKNVVFHHNVYQGGGPLALGDLPLDATAIWEAEPEFVDPPVVPDTGDDLWLQALDPTLISDQFMLLDTSPLIDAGVDPRALAPDDTYRQQLERYAVPDIDGIQRPQGSGFDIGAHERR